LLFPKFHRLVLTASSSGWIGREALSFSVVVGSDHSR